ncbi:MAG TPA: hypothetical protein VH436_29895 [Vicinamibacterales bacterium]
MQYTRIDSEKNGDRRSADADLTISAPDYRPPAATLFVSHTYDASGLQFVRLPGGWTGEALHPPARQFVICVDGHLEVTVPEAALSALSWIVSSALAMSAAAWVGLLARLSKDSKNGRLSTFRNYQDLERCPFFSPFECNKEQQTTAKVGTRRRS